MHAHTSPMSLCGELAPEDVVKLYRQKGYSGVEIMNLHPGQNSAVANSTRYAYETNAKIKTAGSDFHQVSHLACSALRAKAVPEDSFELAKLLKSGDYIFEIGENAIVLP